jgi:hypothetical protein
METGLKHVTQPDIEMDTHLPIAIAPLARFDQCTEKMESVYLVEIDIDVRFGPDVVPSTTYYVSVPATHCRDECGSEQ